LASVVRQGTWGNLGVYHYLGTGVVMDAQERCRLQVLELEAVLGRMLADHGHHPEMLSPSADHKWSSLRPRATKASHVPVPSLESA